MRTQVLAAVLFIVLNAPILASAQDSTSEVTILEDAEGDVSRADSSPASDLLGLYILESKDIFAFRIQVGAMDSQSRLQGGAQQGITIDFNLGDLVVSFTPEDGEGETITVPRDQYRLLLDYDAFGASASIQQYDVSRGQYVDSYHACSPSDCDLLIEEDLESSSWVIHVPRERLQDTDGATPGPGLPLQDFVVTAGSAYATGFTSDGRHDLMPDDGEPQGIFTPVFGAPPQVGHLRLSSAQPFRWSNGEATTYVYDVTLNKTDVEEDEISLSLADVPNGWDVSLPGESLRLEGQRSIYLPVILKTPFSHEHGEFESFFVEVRSARDDEAIGRVELGIRYSTVPQPTGHHSRLWVHGTYDEESQGDTIGTSTNPDDRPRAQSWFISTLDVPDQPGSRDDVIIPPNGEVAYDPADADFVWVLPLEPPLRTGFDFNLTQDGEVQFEFESGIDIPEAVIFGAVYYRKPTAAPQPRYAQPTDTPLAVFYSSSKTAMPAGEPTLFSSPLIPTDESDYIAYRPEGALVFLQVTLRMDSQFEHMASGDASGPWLHPGATIDMPLDEYHDPVEKVYKPLNDVTLEIIGDEKQYVNTGESVVFTMRLNNTGVANERFDLRVSSIGAEWTTILGDTSVSLPSNGTHEVQVVVTAPLDAWQGQIAGPLLQAVSQNDPWAQASVRMFVEVDDETDHPDMSYLLGDDAPDHSKDTPGMGPVAGLLVLVGAILVARRTRRI